MASFSVSVLSVVALALLLATVAVEAQIMSNFYSKSCPGAEPTIASVVKSAVSKDRTKAASLLRLHFHDCFVFGCDGSVLINSTKRQKSEKDALPNRRSLRGFDVIDKAKAAVEKICPRTVSCADILALAARDAVQAIGGPSWSVPTGRRDGIVVSAAAANVSLPSATASFAQLKQNFARVGLNEKDVVVLSGAHTIGSAHCGTIMSRLYNFPGTKDGIDPTLNKAYAAQLKKTCKRGSESKLISMDPSFGGHVFDNNYYGNVLNGKGLFRSDQSLIQNSKSFNLVIKEITSPQANFFNDFGVSMEKMGRIGVWTGSLGEIRQKCGRLNPRKST